jgi:hypothetical protein
MTRADLIAAVRTASDKPYLPERECLAIVRGVLGVVREPSEGDTYAVMRARQEGGALLSYAMDAATDTPPHSPLAPPPARS